MNNNNNEDRPNWELIFSLILIFLMSLGMLFLLPGVAMFGFVTLILLIIQVIYVKISKR